MLSHLFTTTECDHGRHDACKVRCEDCQSWCCCSCHEQAFNHWVAERTHG